MTNIDAIKAADVLRPNAIDAEVKNEWLKTLEAEFCEMMEVDFEDVEYPTEFDLVIPKPYAEAYKLYLGAMIDNYNQEPALYANDMEIANQAVYDAKAWWRRHHTPTDNRRVRV